MTDLTANDDLDALRAQLLDRVAQTSDEAALEQIRVETLGKKGVAGAGTDELDAPTEVARDIVEGTTGCQGNGFGTTSRLDERDRAHAVGHQVSEQIGCLGDGRAPDRCATQLDERRLPQHESRGSPR